MNNNFNKFAFNDAMILDKIQEILEGKNTPAKMPVQYLDSCDLKVNEETAKILGITIPADLK